MKHKGEIIHVILLVGGFSESKYVQERVKLELASLGLQVIIPGNGGLAVLKGAAMMGFTPKCITERKAAYTYGFATAEPFEEGAHPEHLKIVHDGKARCGNVFHKMISKDQILKPGHTAYFLARDTFTQSDIKHQSIITKIYRSNRANPKYCTREEECECVGKITVWPPRAGWPDKVSFENQLTVKESEFVVKVINRETYEEYQSTIDFL